MARFTQIFGVVLILLGLGAYFGTGRESITALIPSFLGIGFIVAGLLMNDPAKLKHAGHAAALLAIVGIAGSARGIPSTLTLLQGGEVERPEAAVVQTVMVVLCLIFVIFAGKTFADARRAKV